MVWPDVLILSLVACCFSEIPCYFSRNHWGIEFYESLYRVFPAVRRQNRTTPAFTCKYFDYWPVLTILLHEGKCTPLLPEKRFTFRVDEMMDHCRTTIYQEMRHFFLSISVALVSESIKRDVKITVCSFSPETSLPLELWTFLLRGTWIIHYNPSTLVSNKKIYLNLTVINSEKVIGLLCMANLYLWFSFENKCLKIIWTENF